MVRAVRESDRSCVKLPICVCARMCVCAEFPRVRTAAFEETVTVAKDDRGQNIIANVTSAVYEGEFNLENSFYLVCAASRRAST